MDVNSFIYEAMAKKCYPAIKLKVFFIHSDGKVKTIDEMYCLGFKKSVVMLLLLCQHGIFLAITTPDRPEDYAKYLNTV